MDNIVHIYTLAEAVDDGILAIIGRIGKRPMVATSGVLNDLAIDEVHGLFQKFLTWQQEVEPTLSEEDRMFAETASNGERIWVIDDGSAVTALYPSEYWVEGRETHWYIDYMSIY